MVRSSKHPSTDVTAYPDSLCGSLHRKGCGDLFILLPGTGLFVPRSFDAYVSFSWDSFREPLLPLPISVLLAPFLRPNWWMLECGSDCPTMSLLRSQAAENCRKVREAIE